MSAEPWANEGSGREKGCRLPSRERALAEGQLGLLWGHLRCPRTGTGQLALIFRPSDQCMADTPLLAWRNPNSFQRESRLAITAQQSSGRGIEGALGFTVCAGMASRQPWRRCNYFLPVYTRRARVESQELPKLPAFRSSRAKTSVQVGFTPESVFLHFQTEVWKNTAFSVITALVQFLGPGTCHLSRGIYVRGGDARNLPPLS